MNKGLIQAEGIKVSEIKGIQKNGLDFSNYIVTKKGEVFNNKTGKFLIPFETHHGYLRVSLWHKNKRQTYYVHQLVMHAFQPNNNPNLEVNHINSDKKCNEISNLEWCTRSQNMLHFYAHKKLQSQTQEVIQA